MQKNWQDLETIQDASEYCLEAISPYKDAMSKSDKEKLAGHILPFSFNTHYSDWKKEYPTIIKIDAYASDLEWSNSSDLNEDWRELNRLICELWVQVHEAHP